MNNDKFLNVYIDILQKTLNDWLLQNVSLQANAKVSEDIIKEQLEQIENLNGMVAELSNATDTAREQLESEYNSRSQSDKAKIENLENAVRDHLGTIANLNALKGEYENVKHQVQHVDTFRNELLKEREDHQKTRRELENKISELTAKNSSDLDEVKQEYETQIKELSDQIDYLQLTPAKRKKIDEEKAKLLSPTDSPIVAETETEPKPNKEVEDGGTF